MSVMLDMLNVVLILDLLFSAMFLVFINKIRYLRYACAQKGCMLSKLQGDMVYVYMTKV